MISNEIPACSLGSLYPWARVLFSQKAICEQYTFGSSHDSIMKDCLDYLRSWSRSPLIFARKLALWHSDKVDDSHWPWRQSWAAWYIHTVYGVGKLNHEWWCSSIASWESSGSVEAQASDRKACSLIQQTGMRTSCEMNCLTFSHGQLKFVTAFQYATKVNIARE